jgi:hypothetical protein
VGGSGTGDPLRVRARDGRLLRVAGNCGRPRSGIEQVVTPDPHLACRRDPHVRLWGGVAGSLDLVGIDGHWAGPDPHGGPHRAMDADPARFRDPRVRPGQWCGIAHPRGSVRTRQARLAALGLVPGAQHLVLAPGPFAPGDPAPPPEDRMIRPASANGRWPRLPDGQPPERRTVRSPSCPAARVRRRSRHGGIEQMPAQEGKLGLDGLLVAAQERLVVPAGQADEFSRGSAVCRAGRGVGQR